MAADRLAAALRRTESVLRRRPSAGLHDDSPGVVRWAGGTRVVARHANGEEVTTDLPVELGGSGDKVSPGWLLRAALASCTATSVVMAAATEGIELESVEVSATSRSDLRGLLGMADADGTEIYPGPQALRMDVRVSADGVPAERLRAIVGVAQRNSPMLRALQTANDVGLHIEIGIN